LFRYMSSKNSVNVSCWCESCGKATTSSASFCLCWTCNRPTHPALYGAESHSPEALWQPIYSRSNLRIRHSMLVSSVQCITIAYPITELISSLMFARTRRPDSHANANKVSPFSATHPQSSAKHPNTASVTPLAATHANRPLVKSFPCHTSEKRGEGGRQCLPPKRGMGRLLLREAGAIIQIQLKETYS